MRTTKLPSGSTGEMIRVRYRVCIPLTEKKTCRKSGAVGVQHKETLKWHFTQ